MNKLRKLAFLVAVSIPLQFASAVPSTFVINEVYGGGGNASAPFNQDFVELFNNGPVAVDISGFSLQYASATGAFATFATFGAGTSIAPGASFLVSAGPVGGVGVALPSINFNGSAGTNFSATAGKIQLLNAALGIVDLVGYGATANAFEGTGPAPAPSNTTSISRTAGVDTDQNSLNFSTGAPTPIPEPTTYMLLGFGVLVCAQRFRSKKS